MAEAGLEPASLAMKLARNHSSIPLMLPLGVEPSVIGYKPIPQNRRGQAASCITAPLRAPVYATSAVRPDT